MPDISLFNETQFLIRPNNRSKHLSTTFGQFNMTSGTFSNVKIVANGSSEQLMSNCAVMSAASKLLSNVFECPCIGCDYVIICPDFEVKPLTKVIDLIHTGSADVCRQELESIQGILDCLQIEQVPILSTFYEQLLLTSVICSFYCILFAFVFLAKANISKKLIAKHW